MRGFCDVAIGTVHKWVDQQGLKSEKDGRERTVALKDLLRFLAVRYANDSSENRARLTAAQADRAEFENSARRGEFISVELFGETLNAVVGEIAGQMAGFPGRVSGKIVDLQDPALVRSRLMDECNLVRTAIANHIRGIADLADQAPN